MKKMIALSALCFLGITSLSAKETNSLLADQNAQVAFKKISLGKALPNWTKSEATASPTKTVVVGREKYQVFNACKPHNCFAEQIAVVYSPSNKQISSVYSKIDDRKGNQQLIWMTNQPEISIELKTILLASLTGALENYPQKFNF